LVFLLPIIVLVTAIAVFQGLNFGIELNLLLSFLLFLSTYFWANRYDKELSQKQIYKIL